MVSEKTIRAFLAVEPTTEIRKAIAALQLKLKGELRGGVSWVRPEGIHLTLKFFGNIAEADIPIVSSMVDEATAGMSPLVVEVRGLGVFPDLRRPRVIWVGTGGEVTKLIDLQTMLEQGFCARGFAGEDRPFRPHLTLARIKQPLSGRVLEKIITAGRHEKIGHFTASSLILFRSDLTPKGATYSKLVEFPLRGC